MSKSEQAFEVLAELWLGRLDDSLGELDPDECDATLQMGVLTLEFADGTRFVINSHRAAQQIWMAANVQAWHFSYDPEKNRWYDVRNHGELIATVEAQVSQKLGFPIKI